MTQGTLATTHKIDLYNGGRRLGPRDLVAVGDRLHFTAITPASNTTLCWTAGTAASTDCYAPLTGSRQGPGKVAAVGSNVYFVLDDGVHGGELWRSRGTAGSVEMVADIAPGAASSWVDHLAVMGGALYFGASEGGGSHGLWKVVP